MSEIDDLKKLIIKLDQAGRKDDAAKLAEQVRTMQAQEEAPKEKPELSLMDALMQGVGNIPGQALGALQSVGSGIAHPVDVGGPAVLNTLEAPGKLLAGLVNKIPGQTPPIDTSKQKEANEFTNAVIENYKQYGSTRGAKEKFANDPLGTLSDAATLLTGGGSMAAKIPMLSRAAEIAAQTGRTIAPTKLPAKAASAILEAGRANRSPGMREMSQTMGDLAAAQSRARELGPEARGYNLTPGGTAATADLIRNPGKNINQRSGLLDVIQKQIDSARDRFDTGVAGVLGQPITQHQLDKSLEAAKSFEADTRQSAKYLAMDADALTPFYADALRRAENNADLRGPLDRIKKTLTLPKTKDPIDRASQVWNVHDAIGKEIASGNDRNNVLGQFQTSVRNLMTKDPDIQQALSQVEQAERLGSARDLGRNVLASGRSTVGPDAIASRAARLSAQERAALSGSVADQLMTLADEKGLNRALEEASRKANNLRVGAALGKDTADRLNQVAQRERSINRTAEKLQKVSEQAPERDVKQTMRSLVRAVPYSNLGGGLGAGLGYMLMSGNWSPAMYALAGAGGGAATKALSRAISRPQVAKANMINMLKTGGADAADMADKLADYTGKGKDYKRFIENLLMALAQSQNMQQQGQ